MKRKYLILVAVVASLAGSYAGYQMYANNTKEESWEELQVSTAPIRVTVPASGSIEPENHITVMAPVNGRIERVLYDEGAKVKAGSVIAWMSSADRAALLDMAKAQGKKAYAKWSKEFRPTPIVAPTSGIVIKKRVVPGQTVTTQSKLYEISDRLIVRAEVDETDIAQVRLGQVVEINVDAFADDKLNGRVIHIAHKSKLSNNVTMYEVEIEPGELTTGIRAGMTASVKFVVEEKLKAKVLPTWLASGHEDTDISLFVRNSLGEPESRKVRVGKSIGNVVEILEGLSLSDIVLYAPVDFLTESKSPLGIFQGKKR